MTPLETIESELARLLDQAKELDQNTKNLSVSIRGEQDKLRQTVKEYADKRFQFFEESLRARGLVWCTQCLVVFAEKDACYMLLSGRKQFSGGYQNSEYGFRDFSGFHRVCPKCRDGNLAWHGTYGEFDRLAEDQTSFFATIVEKREDGYYAHSAKMKAEDCQLPRTPVFALIAEGAEIVLPTGISLEDSLSPIFTYTLKSHDRDEGRILS